MATGISVTRFRLTLLASSCLAPSQTSSTKTANTHFGVWRMTCISMVALR
jgi:hypothetical protein